MRTVLLVEDNPADQDIIVRAFCEVCPDISVMVMDDAEEALNYVLSRDLHRDRSEPSPALILLDLNLPGMSGRELLAQFRDTPLLAHLPVVVFSTSQSEQDVLECYRLGCRAYIAKPFWFEAVRATIRQLAEFWFDTALLPRVEQRVSASGRAAPPN